MGGADHPASGDHPPPSSIRGVLLPLPFTPRPARQAPCAHLGYPGGAVEKNQPAKAGNCKRCKFDPWVGEMPWRRKWQPPPVFFPGKSLGQRSLAGCSPRGRRVREVDTTEHRHIYTWEKRESQLQLNCCVKNFVIGFPEMPPLVADLVEGGPGLHRRVEKVAPVSSRNLTGWPLLVRVTWGSCVVMRTEAKVGSPGPRESWSCVWVSDPWNLRPWGYYSSSDLPCKWGKALVVASACLGDIVP